MLTIITPSFNRGEKLRYLYTSLIAQTRYDFEWMIVDDGSIDNTENIVKEFINKRKIQITYLYKENGGKHTALNYGISRTKNELIFIVDSDDIILSNAVELIYKYHDIYRNQQDICGYCFLRAFPDGRINGKTFSMNELVGSYIDVRINNGDSSSDKAEVFKTSCLKQYPFPEYSGEKFLGEDIIWLRMARVYKMVHINTPIYVSEYLADGLTKNRRKNNIASPIGAMNRAKELMKNDLKIEHRVKGAISYWVYGWFANINSKILFRDTKYKLLTLLCFPAAVIIFYKWNFKYIKK